MDQEYRKMGQEGLKIVFVQNKGKPVSFVKKITYSEIGLGACKIAWSLPAMLACYHVLCNRASTVVSSRAPAELENTKLPQFLRV